MRTNILKIATSLAFALAATSAFAHAQLEKATPAVGSTVSPPSEIRLEFSEGVEPKFTGVTLTSASGASVPVGPAKTETGNAAVLIVPIGSRSRRASTPCAGTRSRSTPITRRERLSSP